MIDAMRMTDAVDLENGWNAHDAVGSRAAGLILAGLVVALPRARDPLPRKPSRVRVGRWCRSTGSGSPGASGFVTVRGENIADCARCSRRLYTSTPEGNRYVGLISVDVATDVGDEPCGHRRYADGTAEQVSSSCRDWATKHAGA